MQVSVTTTRGLERRVEVAVPAKEVASEVEERLRRLSRTARLKGFRPGKAPYAVVRKQFGDQVHAEVIGDLMRSSFAEAVSQEQLKPATGPRIEPIALEPGSDLKYAAVFEVLPEVSVKPFEEIAVERPTAKVTEADIDAMLESMRRQRPVFTPVERAAQTTDRVTVDYDGRIDGKPFEGGEKRDATFILGSGQVLEELDAALVGVKAGDTLTVSVSYPPNHPSTTLAGQTAQLAVTLKKVEAHSLPPIDEEFCRAFGVKDGGIEALRAEVRSSMERELQGVISNRVRGQIMDALYRDNPLEVPNSLVDEAVQRLQIEAAQRMGVRDASQIPPREQFTEAARRRVALGMILGEVVRTEGLKLEPARVQTRLDELVASYPNAEEARRAYAQNADAMRQIESAALEDQVVDTILGRARVSEREMTFQQLTGFGQQQ
jgi:trigger factor